MVEHFIEGFQVIDRLKILKIEVLGLGSIGVGLDW